MTLRYIIKHGNKICFAGITYSHINIIWKTFLLRSLTCVYLHKGVYTKHMSIDISKYETQFLSYAQGFCAAECKQRSMLELKIVHSFAVLKHMHLLVQETLLAPYARACLLAALLHDVARFEQFSHYRTFKDSESCNHGTLGVKILRKLGWLNGENEEIRKLVFASISMHNRFRTPQNLNQDVRLVTLALRDADKLDIFRVMSDHFSAQDKRDGAVVFHAKNDPHAWSENIINDIFANRIASYDDVVYINDFKLLLGSWLHELSFDTTKKALVKSGYLEVILHDVPMADPVQKAKKYIFNLLKKVKV